MSHNFSGNTEFHYGGAQGRGKKSILNVQIRSKMVFFTWNSFELHSLYHSFAEVLNFVTL